MEAVYASPNRPTEWSSPVVWEFSVSEIKNISPSEVFIYIDAKSASEISSSARLCFRANDFTMVSAEIVNHVRGKDETGLINFNGGEPVFTRQTPIPFDMPVFPLQPGMVQTFTIVSKIDLLLTKKKIVEQAVILVSGDAAPLPENLSGLMLLKVICRDNGSGKFLFTQYWHESSPWPVYGESENMKYWMVEQ
jgi:hypothetical protein